MSYNSGSNRARNFKSASRSSEFEITRAISIVIGPSGVQFRDFEITRAITPWIVLHSVQLLLLIVSITKFAIVIGSQIGLAHRARPIWKLLARYYSLNCIPPGEIPLGPIAITNRVSNFKIGRARGWFEITSTITPWIVLHEVQLLINRIYFSSKTGILVLKFAFATANLKVEILRTRRRFARVLTAAISETLLGLGQSFLPPQGTHTEKSMRINDRNTLLFK